MNHFTIVPPPITLRDLVKDDAVQQAKAALGGYGCISCRIGLKEPGEELCIRCLPPDYVAAFKAANEARIQRARDARAGRWA